MLRPDSLNITLNYGGPGSLEGQPKSITFDRGTRVNLFDDSTGLQVGVVSPEQDTVSYQFDGTLLKKLEWKGPNGVNSVKGSVTFSYNRDLQVSSKGLKEEKGRKFGESEIERAIVEPQGKG